VTFQGGNPEGDRKTLPFWRRPSGGGGETYRAEETQIAKESLYWSQALCSEKEKAYRDRTGGETRTIAGGDRDASKRLCGSMGGEATGEEGGGAATASLLPAAEGGVANPKIPGEKKSDSHPFRSMPPTGGKGQSARARPKMNYEERKRNSPISSNRPGKEGREEGRREKT